MYRDVASEGTEIVLHLDEIALCGGRENRIIFCRDINDETEKWKKKTNKQRRSHIENGILLICVRGFYCANNTYRSGVCVCVRAVYNTTFAREKYAFCQNSGFRSGAVRREGSSRQLFVPVCAGNAYNGPFYSKPYICPLTRSYSTTTDAPCIILKQNFEEAPIWR